MATLNTVGKPEGISYGGGGRGESLSPDGIEKNWTLSFQASPSQLRDQLDRFRTNISLQLPASGASITGDGRWTGDFSGFSFAYSSGGRRGLVRVTGVSLESGRQGLEILLIEH
jgi:hypothetical protein